MMQLQLVSPIAIPLSQLRCEVTHRYALVAAYVNMWHSWLTAPQGWKVAFVLTDGVTIYGVSTWGRPVARLEDQETTLEHTRMALCDAAPRNSGTWFLAQNRKWIRENMPHIKRCISYVPSERHTGIVYRGDNWRTVYVAQAFQHTWTNRAGRKEQQYKIRTKFEREP